MMKVNTMNTVSSAYQYENMQRHKNEEDSSEKSEKIKEDKVTISQEALNKVKEENAQMIRQKKVEEIKSQIENGTFVVNANVVADRMIQKYKDMM